MSLGKEIGVRDDMEWEDRSLILANDKRQAVKRSTSGDEQKLHFHFPKTVLDTFYDIIFDPIQDLLVESELIFVPEGPLCLTPFAVFKAPNSKYLCESFRIRVAPSLTGLKMIDDCPVDYHRRPGVHLVGESWVQGVTKLPTLPYAREEVEVIGRLLGCAPLV